MVISVFFCVSIALFSAISPSVTGLNEFTNSTLTTTTSLPNIAGSTNITSSTDISSESSIANQDIGEKSIKLPFTPVSTPNIEKAVNGSWIESSDKDSQNHWWVIDYWTNSWGYPLPSKMSGQFVLAENTITGLEENDAILYLPLNFAYGTSSSNFVWYQFCVYYKPDGEIVMTVWEFQNGANGKSHYVNLNYVPGHTYYFEMSQLPWQDSFIFIISDVTASNTWTFSNWYYSVPGTTMIYLGGCFSPASALEGYTSSSYLYDVPYFQTYVGEGITAHYRGTAGSGMPNGIDLDVYAAGSNHYNWAMHTSNWYYVDEITMYDTYGPGSSISNPEYLAGQYPNNYFASIYGANPGDGGFIVGEMNAFAGGRIFIRGYSVAGYYSDLYVYVANDLENWQQVGSKLTITQSTAYWIDIGTYQGSFKYIAVAGYDSANSVNLRLDSVKVHE